jgi:Family of unknown function (DUF5302)
MNHEPSTPADSQEPSGQSEHANDDVRAKMREALDRKNEKARAGEAHLEGHEKAHGVHGKSGGGREFRRKTGG